jgi:outer membrane protein OmpA-like peptidoglycan-associated protein
VKSIAFSQTDTSKVEKCFPMPVVKQIMKDLVSGDEDKAQLKLTEQQLLETEKKVSLKDSVITTLRLKEVNYQTIIDSEKQKFDIMDRYSKKLEFDLKKEKVKNKFKSILGTGAIAVLTFFLITK